MFKKDKEPHTQAVKIELLQMYQMQMDGLINIDNKQLNEISTASSGEDFSSEFSESDEMQELRKMLTEDEVAQEAEESAAKRSV